MPNKIQTVQAAPAPSGIRSYMPEGGKVKAMASSLFAKENLIFAAKVAGGVLAAGATMAALGYGLENAGAWMGEGTNSILANAGNYVEAGGRGLFTAGKYTAYTVLVPTYMAAYQGPRWIITTGLPEGAKLLNSYVLQPGAENIRWLANKAVDGASYVHQRALKPIAEKASYFLNEYIAPSAGKVIEWSKDKLVALYDLGAYYVLSPLASGAKSALNLAKQYLYQPLTQAFDWAAAHVIHVIGLANEYIAQPLMNHVMAPIGNALTKVGQIAYTYLVAPVASGLVSFKDAVLPHLQKAAVAVATFAMDFFTWTAKGAYDYVWAPVAAFTSKKFYQGAELAHTYIVEPVAANASKLCTAVENEISSLFGY